MSGEDVAYISIKILRDFTETISARVYGLDLGVGLPIVSKRAHTCTSVLPVNHTHAPPYRRAYAGLSPHAAYSLRGIRNDVAGEAGVGWGVE